MLTCRFARISPFNNMSVLYDFFAGAVRRVYAARITGSAVLEMDSLFPDGERFKRAWPQLHEEAMQLMARLHSVPRFHELMASQAEISANDGIDWRMFVLRAYGVDIAENQAACPCLAQLVASSPDVLSASLSFLAPHKHIPPHRGPFRGVLRFQLGIAVPRANDGKPAAVLVLDGREHYIGDGAALLWDDTFTHEVRNRSDQVRIALLLDVRRRGQPWDMAFLSWLVIRCVNAAIRLRRALEWLTTRKRS